jgi:hypothetical protein
MGIKIHCILTGIKEFSNYILKVLTYKKHNNEPKRLEGIILHVQIQQ